MDSFRSAWALLVRRLTATLTGASGWLGGPGRIRAFAIPLLLVALVMGLAGCDEWFP